MTALWKTAIIQCLDWVAPKWSIDLQWHRFLGKEARKLRDKCAALTDIEAVVEEVLNHEFFKAVQRKSEIAELLKTLQQSPPTCICEIGSDLSGTLFLFAHVASPRARILSLDVNYPTDRRQAVKKFAADGQRIDCLKGDTHAAQTWDRVKKWLRGGKFDFLFIDGDHSLEGVRQDFQMYGPLVTENGIVAFHDIVPDSKIRCGIPTGADVGEVPFFWSELKQQGYKTREIIANPDQDGMGIGVVYLGQGSALQSEGKTDTPFFPRGVFEDR